MADSTFDTINSLFKNYYTFEGQHGNGEVTKVYRIDNRNGPIFVSLYSATDSARDAGMVFTNIEYSEDNSTWNILALSNHREDRTDIPANSSVSGLVPPTARYIRFYEANTKGSGNINKWKIFIYTSNDTTVTEI